MTKSHVYPGGSGKDNGEGRRYDVDDAGGMGLWGEIIGGGWMHALTLSVVGKGADTLENG